ncbi:MAG: hypothetical protein HYX40_12295 [Sphingobacteriales bacterium]|nr:hypothetical protein [Sphingobacteriales bacterium]
MSKSILKNLCILLLLPACITVSRNSSADNYQSHKKNQHFVRESGIDTSEIDPSYVLASHKPLSLTDLPQSENGEIVLAKGFYEAEFKSYCLQPGTPDPSERDAYLQTPLNTYHKDIIETVLRNSLKKPELEQRNIQLLLWSIVSGSNFNKLSWPVQNTAKELLSRKQIFQLKGGVMGVLKTVSTYIPASSSSRAFGEMKQLFEMGNNSYEAYERIAVLRKQSDIKHPDYKKEQWYKQPEGYYLRYFPAGYQHVKIQVYVPDESLDTSGLQSGNYLLFDPVTMMATPANSNAQNLGIGAPVGDIIRKIIKINKNSGPVKKIPVPAKDPKKAS